MYSIIPGFLSCSLLIDNYVAKEVIYYLRYFKKGIFCKFVECFFCFSGKPYNSPCMNPFGDCYNLVHTYLIFTFCLIQATCI